jgi:diketogulonate reductase-like aldo/keto reductase
MLYGTAWKEERTPELTRLALEKGFTGIDTANQRRHYYEEAVGDAVAGNAAGMSRGDLFLQTKFTYAISQDRRLPYDPKANYATQTRQSIESSLRHLKTSYVDAYLLHGPSRRNGLGPADREVWSAMEALQREGRTRLIGLSNVSLEQLAEIHSEAEVKPAFVQNRCYARDGWGCAIRAFCRAHGVLYQGFSLLTANARELERPAARQVAARHGKSIAQVVFRFALQIGIVPITGTTSAAHMDEALACFDFELDEDEVRELEAIGEP